MAERRAAYAPEYRRQMVELVRAGRTPGELGREFECPAQAIRNWVRQADRDEGRRRPGRSGPLRGVRRAGRICEANLHADCPSPRVRRGGFGAAPNRCHPPFGR